MEDQIHTFLSVTGVEDESVAKQYLDITNGDLEYAVTLYMESNPPQNAGGRSNNDEELAQRLQQEAYERGEVIREADANVHRHETLVESFGGIMPHGLHSRPTDIFGRGRAGVFNQRFDDDENEFYEDRHDQEEDEDYQDLGEKDDDEDDDIMVIDSDGEVIEQRPMSRRRLNRYDRQNELTSTQRRLANLFRPPFDILSRIDLDSAKIEGREESKWILINIQDASEFQCQILNRDFWSNWKIKEKVRENFIFLQYQNDSPNGLNYLNFYSTEKFPHISILDPLTGERVFKWTDGEVPDVNKWLNDVDGFLSQFSLLPNTKNPMVKHDVTIDPDSLSEEQQIEFAMKQSILDSQGTSTENAIAVDDEVENEVEDEQKIPEAETAEEVDPFDNIKSEIHEEPTSGEITRVQIRFPNGKRIIHKFRLDDKVVVIYQWLKFILIEKPGEYGISGEERFNLSNFANKSVKLIDSLDLTINEANLKNASISLEKE